MQNIYIFWYRDVGVELQKLGVIIPLNKAILKRISIPVMAV